MFGWGCLQPLNGIAILTCTLLSVTLGNGPVGRYSYPLTYCISDSWISGVHIPLQVDILYVCMWAPCRPSMCWTERWWWGEKKKRNFFSMPRKGAGVRMRHMSLFENNPLNLWIDYDLVGSWAQIYRLCHTLYRLLYSAGLSNVPLSLEWDRLVEGERGDYFGHFCYYSHNNIASL